MMLSGYIGLLVLWAVGPILLLAGTYLAVRLRFRRTQNIPLALPGISVLKPLKGLDHGLYENLESFFLQDYPDYELIISVSDSSDLAIPVVRALLQKYPVVKAKLIVEKVAVSFNPKVNNLIRAYERAKNDLILVSDSNIRVTPGHLKTLVSSLDEDTGIITARVAGHEPKNFSGRLEAMFLNTHYARAYIFIPYLLGHPVVMGKTMLFRKSQAERFGGLRFLGQFIAEDYMSGESFLKLGLKIKMITEPVVQIIGQCRLRDFWARHIRWGRIHKAHSPAAFLLTPFTGMIFSGVLGAACFYSIFNIPPLLFFAIHCTAWQCLDLLTIWSMDSKLRLTDMSVWVIRELLSFPMWLRTAFGSTVSWRGRSFRIRRGGMLEEYTPSRLRATRAAMFILVSLLGIFVVRNSAGGALTAKEVLKNSVQNLFHQSEESLYLMRLIEGDGTEVQRKMRVWYKRTGDQSAKLLIRFLDPADIRNTGLLSIHEAGKSADQWIYLPAVKKVRRIRGGNDSESFLGSDFTIGDLTSAETDEALYDYKLSQIDKQCGDKLCHEIIALPRNGDDISDLPYSKKVLLIRKDTSVAQQIEFYNPSGTLEKIMKLQAALVAQSWLIDQVELKNVLTGHKTIIEIQKRNQTKELSDSLFTQASLEKI